MAVENKYTNTLIAANTPAPAIVSSGAKLVVFAATFEIAAGDDDGSVYRIFKSVPSWLIPVRIEVGCDAITNGTDFDLGFYKKLAVGGDVIDKDNLMDGQTLATASLMLLNGLGAVDVANIEKRFFELAGYTNLTDLPEVDIALTANTVGTGAGTVSVRMWCAQG